MSKLDNLRVVFMGTPEFAVESLKILVENKINIVGVITAPDKPAGRGNKIHQSDVKKYALTQNLNILQPTNLKNETFLEELRALKADLQVVVAFRMLPEVVWNMPKHGSFNLHGSLLPNYRGAAPIHWAVINGEKETGVTTFFLKHKIDTGNIIFQEKTTIEENETTGELYYRLMKIGAELTLKTIQAVFNDDYTLTPQQENDNAPHAPKIFKDDAKINWENNAQDIHNLIRGMHPFPCAFFEMQGKNYKVHKATFTLAEHNKNCGEFLIDKESFKVTVKDGFITILKIQAPGKPARAIDEFLRGFRS